MASGTAYNLVAIACSAGGLGGLQKILSALPSDFPAAVVVAQHRGNYPIDLLLDLLRASSSIPVSAAGDFERLSPGRVYVCPQGRHIQLLNQRLLRTWEGPRLGYARPSADLLFESVAKNFGKRGLCVVLSGGGSDGAFATRLVHSAGGFVIAQDQRSAAVPEMPAAALELGHVDLVLPPEHIGFAINELVGTPMVA